VSRPPIAAARRAFFLEHVRFLRRLPPPLLRHAHRTVVLDDGEVHLAHVVDPLAAQVAEDILFVHALAPHSSPIELAVAHHYGRNAFEHANPLFGVREPRVGVGERAYRDDRHVPWMKRTSP
jgi:hypothetical protein